MRELKMFLNKHIDDIEVVGGALAGAFFVWAVFVLSAVMLP